MSRLLQLRQFKNDPQVVEQLNANSIKHKLEISVNISSVCFFTLVIWLYY